MVLNIFSCTLARKGVNVPSSDPLPSGAPPPPPTPSPQHVPPPPLTPQDRTNMGGQGKIGQGDRETQGEVTWQGRPRSPKLLQSAEGGKGKEKRIIVVVRSPCQENYPADAHTGAYKSVLESANPA